MRTSIFNGEKLGRQFVDYLIQITDILCTLHEEQIVHRDATPNNYMITPRKKVALIDMELSYSLQQQYPSPAFQLGTYGYMSPQQEAMQTPTTAEDIYALGAIMLQMWSGITPDKLTKESIESLKEKVNFFIPDQPISKLILQCLDTEDIHRPQAREVQQVLQQFKADLRNKVVRPPTQCRLYSRDEILSTVQESIHTLATPLLADGKKGWFANDMKPPAEAEKHTLRKKWYASYNRGVSGIMYLLSQANRMGLDITASVPYIDKGLDLIRTKYINHINTASCGLHFGSDGIAAMLASSIQHGLFAPSAEYLEWINLLLDKESTKIDVANGIAGQGIANLVSSTFVAPQRLQERLQRYAELLISKQDKAGAWINGFYYKEYKYLKIKKSRITRGFAEGMAGIVYFLLEYGYKYKDDVAIKAAQRGLQWFMKMAKPKKGTVQWTSAKDKELNHDWAEGTAGIALMFIKAYQLSGKQPYKDYATRALLSIPENITNGNIGQRSGLSGLGEVYLEAHRAFNENLWLQRAGWIAQVIMHLKKQHPKYGSFWLVEHERQPVANFMTGNSGVIHFLLRYCYPDNIHFPLIP